MIFGTPTAIGNYQLVVTATSIASSSQAASTTATYTLVVDAAPAPVVVSSGGGGGGGGYYYAPPVVTNSSTSTVTTSTSLQAPLLSEASSLPTPSSLGQVLGATAFNFSSNLTLGMSGDNVTQLQNRLTTEGVYSGPITGYFGHLTLAAVKAYQTKYNISPASGYVGPLTRAQLNNNLFGETSSTTSTTSYGTTTPQFSNWLMSARNVTSSRSYKVQVGWGLTQPNQATSSINASGSQLLAGVSVPKTLFSGDYTDNGDPVSIVASGSLYDLTGTSTLIGTTTISFYEKTIPATSNCGSTNIQCIAYTYDANGNITQIADNSASNAAKTVNYTYDHLNRLTLASSSNAVSGSNYRHAFTYDALGNILTGPAGTYTYGSTSSSTYADPDAVTSILTSLATTTSVSFDASASLNPTVASTTLTFPLTVTSTANRVLLVGVTAMASSNTSTAASYNGTPMSLLMNIGNVNTEMQVWYLKNPASGTHNVSVTIVNASANVIPVAVSFANAAGTGNTASLLSQGTSTALSITSSNGNKVVDFLNELIGSGANPILASGQTLLVATTNIGQRKTRSIRIYHGNEHFLHEPTVDVKQYYVLATIRDRGCISYKHHSLNDCTQL